MNRNALRQNIFEIKDENDFIAKAIDVFHYQYSTNKIYRTFSDGLKIKSSSVEKLADIPFLPVEFFKSNEVKSEIFKPEEIFTSSSTSGEVPSRHFVREINLYDEDFVKGFNAFYGKPEEYVFLALLPSYLEREGSSLIYMMEYLIRQSKNELSGFFLNEHEKLFSILSSLKKEKRKVILLGVTYALLDFAEKFRMDFPELIIIETGGMKGKRKEMVREEVHSLLKIAFGVEQIHSEYGMTELLSQAWSQGDGIFQTPPWMKIMIRDIYNPMQIIPAGQNGGINIIDLGNLDSCSFLATQDLGRCYDDGSFGVTGRFDFSDIRGCNLMIE